MKKKVKLAVNIGNIDREKYGLVDYELADLTEGKEISVDDKTAKQFVVNGWVATDGGDKAAPAAEPEEESPLADTPVAEATQMIANMRSKDKLQALIDTDPRVGVKDAAKKRLASLQ